MKKFKFSIIGIFLVTIIAFLVSCSGSKLSSPRNMDLIDDTFTWDPVDGADGYVIYFNEDLSNRYFVKDTSISLDNKEIFQSLKSGVDNLLYVRAVKLDKNNMPVSESDRSCIIFDYSRKLATPNKVSLKNEKFTWRSVSEAKDYKALVRKTDEAKGTLYDMEWQAGTTGINGTIKELANGYLYYVSIIAIAEGFENSDPSVEVPYDLSTSSVNGKSYFLVTENGLLPMSKDGESYVIESSFKVGDTIQVSTSTGNGIAITDQITVNGDYRVTVDKTEKVTVTKILNYYIYVNEQTVGQKFKTAGNNFEAVVKLSNGDKYTIKDDIGNLIQTFTDDAVNKGQVYTDGNYTFTINTSELISVVAGGEIDKPVSVNGKWPVTFDYNFKNSPSALVVYADHNKPVGTPASPSRYGYIFEGWFEDKYCLIAADFGTKQSLFTITSPTTFYAKWTKDESIPDIPDQPDQPDQPGPDTPVNPVDTEAKIYLDVSKFTWFKDNSAEINVNILYKDGTNNTFPGTVMKENATLSGSDGLVYEATYYINRGIKSVIFTRNDPTSIPAQGIKTEWNRIEIGELNFDNDKPLFKLQTYSDQDNSFTGKWMALGEVDYDDQDDGNDKLYLDFRDVSWFLDYAPKVYAYIAYADGSENATFPGREITYTADFTATQYSGYVYYNSSKQVTSIIFTRNNPNVTIGEGIDNKFELTDAQILAFDTRKPAFRMTNASGNIFEGVWETEEEALKPNSDTPVTPDIPDVQTTIDDTVNAYLYLDVSNITWFANDNAVITAKVNYSDNSYNGQTGAPTVIEAGLYKFGYNSEKNISSIEILRLSTSGEVWNTINISMTTDLSKTRYIVVSFDSNESHSGYWDVKGADETEEKDTIYFYNNDSWDNVYAYAFSGSGDNVKLHLGTWPGSKMTAVADHEGWLSIDVAKSATMIIFSNGISGEGSHQTEDLAINREKLYYKGTWYSTFTDEEEPEPVVEKDTIYFYNEHNWDKVYAYAFTGLKYYTAEWPGDEMIPVEGHTGWYKADIDKRAEMIVFNNVTKDKQTADLIMNREAPYFNSGEWVSSFDVEVAPWDGTITIDVSEISWWGDASAYIYIWYVDDTKNANWPGEVMTKTSEGHYEYTIDTTKTVSGIIVIRGNGTDTIWNKTGDMTLPDSHSISVTILYEIPENERSY